MKLTHTEQEVIEFNKKYSTFKDFLNDFSEKDLNELGEKIKNHPQVRILDIIIDIIALVGLAVGVILLAVILFG